MSNDQCQAPQFEEMQLSGTSIISLFPDNKIKLECVSNFRTLGGLPIAGSDGKLVIRPGTIHRTAAPTNASQSDEFWLLEILQIKTMIDLRTTWENKTISPVRKFEDNFVQYSVKKEDRETVANVLYTPDGNVSANGSGGRGRSASGGSGSSSKGSMAIPPVEQHALSTSYQGPGYSNGIGIGSGRGLDLSPTSTSSSSSPPPQSTTTSTFLSTSAASSTSTTATTSTSTTSTTSTSLAGSWVSSKGSGSPLSRSVDGHLSPTSRQKPIGADNANISPPKIHVTPSKRASPPSQRAEREKEMEEQRNGLIWRLYNRNLTNDDILNLRKHSTGTLRKRYCIPLINNRFFLEGVYQTAPNETKVKCTVSRYLFFNDKIGAFLLMNHLNQLGISEMYRLTLLYTQEEILTIMRIFKRKENYPLMYYCSLGKDRTGMITALLLSCLGVPRDVIIEDYAKSEVNLTPFFEQIRRYFTRVGLVKEEFAKAPREVMAGMLNWVDETYGGVPEYLEMIGFSRQEQDELKANLIVPIEEYRQLLDQTRASLLPNLHQRHDDYLHLKRSSPKLSFASPNSRFWRRMSVTKELDLHANK